jgi:hypothetical protein
MRNRIVAVVACIALAASASTVCAKQDVNKQSFSMEKCFANVQARGLSARQATVICQRKAQASAG